jgi:hypothetical protein
MQLTQLAQLRQLPQLVYPQLPKPLPQLAEQFVPQLLTPQLPTQLPPPQLVPQLVQLQLEQLEQLTQLPHPPQLSQLSQAGRTGLLPRRCCGPDNPPIAACSSPVSGAAKEAPGIPGSSIGTSTVSPGDTASSFT